MHKGQELKELLRDEKIFRGSRKWEDRKGTKPWRTWKIGLFLILGVDRGSV